MKLILMIRVHKIKQTILFLNKRQEISPIMQVWIQNINIGFQIIKTLSQATQENFLCLI